MPSPTRQSTQSGPRARAASATLPLGLDLRHQYRALSSHGLSHSSQPSTPRSASVLSYGSPPPYSNGFPSAPLTAPVDYSMPRTPGMKASMPDYSASQLSAPMAASAEFGQALDTHMSSSHASTPTRDSFAMQSGHGAGYGDEAGPTTKRRRSSLGMY